MSDTSVTQHKTNLPGTTPVADQTTARERAAAPTGRLRLILPAFPTSGEPTTNPHTSGASPEAPESIVASPEPVKPVTGQLTHFPLAILLTPPPADQEADTALDLPDPVAAHARHPLLPAAEVRTVNRKVFAVTGPAVTGDGSIIENRVVVPARRAVPAPAPQARSFGWADLQALLPDSPFVLAGLLITLGAGFLAWTYGLRLPRPYNYLLFWNALGLCLVGTLLYGLNDYARSRHHLFALATFGTITWLPHFFRSPEQSLFSDELFHFQILRQIAELGHSRLPITFYPIPGEFPGLHFSALALAGATGLPLEWSARLLTLVIHAAIPALAYVAARGSGLGRRGAFIAALI